MSQHRTRDPDAAGRETDASGIIRSDDLQIRNYDRQWAYDLDVEVRTTRGVTALERHYYLQPGQREAEAYVLPSGEYEVRATLDNSHTERLRCRIDSAPEHTAVIEVGNGTFSLTRGL